jgi:hsp70-interacting protein
MEKQLLKWALENSGTPASGDDGKELNSEKLAFLSSAFGPADSTKMKECVRCITDKQDATENKLIALDNLELLVESIDNACDVEKLNLWSPLLDVLNDGELTCGVLWVVGTAAQNNRVVQDLLVEKHKILPQTIKLLHSNPPVSKKALYAISSLLCENENSKREFEALDGLHHLKTCCGVELLKDRINFIIETVLNKPG